MPGPRRSVADRLRSIRRQTFAQALLSGACGGAIVAALFIALVDLSPELDARVGEKQPQSQEDASPSGEHQSAAYPTAVLTRFEAIQIQIYHRSLVATCLLVGITAIYVFFSLQQWIAMLTANRLSSESTKRELRAYITVKAGSIFFQRPDVNAPFEARPVIVNAGKTPARNVRTGFKIKVLPFPLPESIGLTAGGLEGGGSIGPGETREAFFVSLDRVLSDEEVSAIQVGGNERLYVYGLVEYTDAFGDNQFTVFCQYIAWDADGNPAGIFTARFNNAT